MVASAIGEFFHIKNMSLIAFFGKILVEGESSNFFNVEESHSRMLWLRQKEKDQSRWCSVRLKVWASVFLSRLIKKDL